LLHKNIFYLPNAIDRYLFRVVLRLATGLVAPVVIAWNFGEHPFTLSLQVCAACAIDMASVTYHVGIATHANDTHGTYCSLAFHNFLPFIIELLIYPM
jgi:hypothetical protein